MESFELIGSLLAPGSVSKCETPKSRMPLAVKAAFDVSMVRIYGVQFAVAHMRPGFSVRDYTPSELMGLIDMVSAKMNHVTILHADRLTPYLKKKCLTESRPFICDDGQFFVPALININNDRLPARGLVERTEMSPSTKLLFIYLLGNAFGPYTVEEAQACLGLSRATVQKSFEELVSAGLLRSKTGGKTGRKRTYFAKDEDTLFKKGREAFGKAVKKTFCVLEEDLPVRSLSGLSALAERSLLLAPPRRIYALSASDARALTPIDPDEGKEGVCDIQVLSYDPKTFACEGVVDRFTMLATVDNNSDERIAMAIEEAMKGCIWYR